MQLSNLLAEQGLTSGPVYATGILKGYEAAQLVADFKAQETIRQMTSRILGETGAPDGMNRHNLDRFSSRLASEWQPRPWPGQRYPAEGRDRSLQGNGS